MPEEKKPRQRFTFTIRFSAIPVTQAEWEATENLLARMVARAIAAEHPRRPREDKGTRYKAS